MTEEERIDRRRQQNREANRRWCLAHPDGSRLRQARWRKANPERARALRRKQYQKWRAANPRALRRRWTKRERHIWYAYKLTQEEYEHLLEEQGGCCAVPTCRATKSGGRTKYFHIDHNHATGEIRGLTCTKCNIAIHSGRDNKEFLLGVIEYLGRKPYVTRASQQKTQGTRRAGVTGAGEPILRGQEVGFAWAAALSFGT